MDIDIGHLGVYAQLGLGLGIGLGIVGFAVWRAIGGIKAHRQRRRKRATTHREH